MDYNDSYNNQVYEQNNSEGRPVPINITGTEKTNSDASNEMNEEVFIELQGEPTDVSPENAPETWNIPYQTQYNYGETGYAYRDTDYAQINNTYGYYNQNDAYMNYDAGAGQQTQQEKPKKEKKEKKKGSGKFAAFAGKAAMIIAAGLVFGLCASLAFSLVNYYTGNNAITAAEDNSDIDLEEYKNDIVNEIMEKLNSKSDAIVYENVGTDDNMTVVMDVSDVVDEVMPSVVAITNNYTYTTNFFGSEYTSEGESTGSGIIIGESDAEFLIATNNHVIDQADSLFVQFIDGAVVEAKLKGADADNDIAVIAVNKEQMEAETRNSLAVARLGDSDSLRVGESAIAIGNSLGYGQSVTTGVISALDRQLELEDGSISDGLIQTDAAINPGNSGGALLNYKGEVIGINSSKIGGEVVEGMGYAIPISKALPIIDNLKTKKTKDKVAEGKRGYLGISGRGVSEEMSQMYDIPEGVYISEIYPGTGAEKAKLRNKDIITKFEGSTINSMEKLQEYIAYYEAGETVVLTIERLNEEGAYEAIDVVVELVDESYLPSE